MIFTAGGQLLWLYHFAVIDISFCALIVFICSAQPVVFVNIETVYVCVFGCVAGVGRWWNKELSN